VNAVGYARYSSSNQREESITAQLRSIYEYAAKNDINITKVYTDEALTATNDDRPDFQRMIAELPITSPGLVLVHKLDRFARNKYDAAFYRREITKAHARLIAVDQDFGVGPEADLMEGILEGFAEYFSSNLGREVKKGMTENAMQGKHCGGVPPLGLDVDAEGKYIINNHEAQAIRIIFERKLSGKSYSAIQNELAALGHKSKTGRPIGANSLHDILRNEKYNGTFVLRKTSPSNSHKAADPAKILRIEGAIPRIVDADTFTRVQELLDINKVVQSRQREDKPIQYLLSGILRCGICGGAMTGDSKGGKGYYRCSKAKRTKECSNKARASKDFIEDKVLNKIAKESKNIKNIEATTDMIYKRIRREYGDSTKCNELKKSLAKIEKEFANLTNSIASGVDPRLLADTINETGRQRERLKIDLAQIDTTFNITKEDIRRLLEKRKQIVFDKKNEESCFLAIREAVKQVTFAPPDVIQIKLIGLI
jgi:site-specific DNA recombinase